MKTFLNKVKENKATLLKLLVLLLIVALISLITLGVLFATGVLYYEDGFVFDAHIFDSFSGKWYGFIVFILAQALLSILLCFIPGVAMAFVMLSTVIYPGKPWLAFLLSYSCVIVASTALYSLGRAGGYKICAKLLGKEESDKALDLLRTRGTVYFPLMMLFPIFPDDALVMIAGVTKMKLSWFIPSILICRGVGAATIIFGMALIPYETFTSFFEWLILITVCFFWVQEIFKFAGKADRYFEHKRNPKEGDEQFLPSAPKNYLKLYRTLVTIIVSLSISFISFGFISVFYQWLIVITIAFFWVREIFIIADKIQAEISYNKKARAAAKTGTAMPAYAGSANTFHSIATAILCFAILVIHLTVFGDVLIITQLVTASFFWIREIFKVANKIDRYIYVKRHERAAAINGAIEKALEEPINLK